MKLQHPTAWAALVALLAPTVAMAGFPITLESVVNSTDAPVPGAPGTNWLLASNSAFGAPTIDNAGNVAFLARLGGVGVTAANNTGYWYGAPGSLSLVTRLGDAPLPGGGGATYNLRQKTTVPISPAGHMWIAGGVSAGNGATAGQNDRLIWSGQNGAMSKLAARRDAAPGTASTFSSAVDSTSSNAVSINNAGQSLVSSELTVAAGNGITSGVNNAGAWIGTPAGGLTKVWQAGDQAPGQPNGDLLGLGALQYLNGSGQVAMTMALRGTAVTASNADTVLTNTGGSMRVAAREGGASPIPGVNYGADTSQFGSAFNPARQALNNNGEFLFQAFLATGSATTDFGLFVDDGSTTSLVKQEGDAAPGVAGATISSFNSFETRINNDSLFAWVAQMAGTGGTTNDQALWLSAVSGAGDVLVAREGDSAPGIPGARLGSLSSILLNNRGEIVFQTSLQTGFGGVTTANDRTMWAWREDVGLQLVAREGDTLFGTLVSNFSYVADANADGGSVSLSDTGWLTFSITGAGATATGSVIRTMIPEPASLALLALGGIAVIRRRR